MKEAELRKWHRRVGIGLALFLFIQAATGVLLNLEGLFLPRGHAHLDQKASVQSASTKEVTGDPIEFLHHGGGFWGAHYRLALGIATIWMAASGISMYLKIRSRARARPR